jgi:hypothetical protein
MADVRKERFRARVRRELEAHNPTIALLAAQVRNAGAGPDPEAALVYAAELRDDLDELIRASNGREVRP